MASPNTACTVCGQAIYRRPCHQARASVCSRACKSHQTRVQFKGKESGQWAPFCTQEELYADYVVNRMSVEEVALARGVTRKRVCTSLRKEGIPTRARIKRDQWGHKNDTWKGTAISYKGAHQRVARMRGTPQQCEECDRSGPDGKYEWANLTGRFHDPNDYRRLCTSCHRAMDGNSRNLGDYLGGKRRHWRRDRHLARAASDFPADRPRDPEQAPSHPRGPRARRRPSPPPAGGG